MRTIRRLSAAFQLLDGYSKGPVTGASVLVDGGRVKYAAKGDGTYVFSDLPPVPHTYEFSAPGFCPACRTLPVVPAHIPEVVLMQYQPGTPALGRIAHFRLRFRSGGAPLSGAAVRATLTTPVGALRLVERAEQGSRAVTLAGNYSPVLAYQRCCPRQEGAEDLVIAGYDREAGQVILQEPLAAPLGEGTLLQPVWELETDRDGTAILPAIGLFLQREEVELSFTWEGHRSGLTTAPPSPAVSAVIEF